MERVAEDEEARGVRMEWTKEATLGPRRGVRVLVMMMAILEAILDDMCVCEGEIVCLFVFV